MSKYEYDVFISYKRSTLIESWVTNNFLGLFTDWLTEKILAVGGKEPKIFFDRRAIEPGTIWPDELREALAKSKVLVPICSPTYFQSKWCLSEWSTFIEREKALGKNRLRIPVRHNDCEDHLGNLSWFDFYGLTYPIEGFVRSIHSIDFHNKIEALAETVARAVVSAPDFNPNWPVIIAEEPKDQPILISRI